MCIVHITYDPSVYIIYVAHTTYDPSIYVTYIAHIMHDPSLYYIHSPYDGNTDSALPFLAIFPNK
jgi:hypothetical protein